MATKKSLNPNILVFTVQAGGGHISLAKAFVEIIKSKNKNIIPTIINVNTKTAEFLYRYFGNQFASTFSDLWEWANNEENTRLISQVFTLMTHQKIEKDIKKYQPKIIISTDPHSISTVQVSLQNLNLHIPHYVYVADPFSIHQIWAVKPQADYYLVANSETSKALQTLGIPAAKIIITGFLVRNAYYQTYPPIKRQKKTIFIGGSGDGGGSILKLIKRFSKDPSILNQYRLIVSCGKNKVLKTQLEMLPELKHLNLTILGYTPNLHRYIAQSDVVIGKPGPNILFESIMLGKPFIATGEPLAQEVGNYGYIDQEGIGYGTTSPRLAHSKINPLLSSPKLYLPMKERVLAIRKTLLDTPEKVWQALSLSL